MEKKLSAQKITFTVLLCLWIIVTCLVILALHLPVYWPAFAILNLLTITGFTKANYIKIFASSVSGMVFAMLDVLGTQFLTPYLGAEVAAFTTLFFVMFVILAFDKVFPTFLNIYAFVIFTFSTVNLPSFYKSWGLTIVTALVGGGIAVIGTVGIEKFVAKLFSKRKGEEKAPLNA